MATDFDKLMSGSYRNPDKTFQAPGRVYGEANTQGRVYDEAATGTTIIPDYHKDAMGIPRPGATTIPDYHKEAMIPRTEPLPGAAPDIFSKAPIPGGQTFTGPEGQQATIPESGFPQREPSLIQGATPPKGSALAEIDEKRKTNRDFLLSKGYTPEEADRVSRGEAQATAKNELLARVEIRKKLDAMREGGASDADIAKIGKEIGTGRGLSAQEMSKRLGARMKSKQEGAQGRTSQQDRSRRKALEGSNYRENEDGTRTPMNQQAIANEAFDWMDTFGEDAESGSMEKSMTASEKRLYERSAKSLASGIKSSRDEKNIKDIQKKVADRKARDYTKKQAKVEREKAELTNQKIKDGLKQAETKEFYDTRQKKLASIEKRLKGSFNREEKSTGGLKDQLKELQAQLQEEVIAGPPIAPPPSLSGKVPVGQKKDASGKVIQIAYSDGTIEDV